MKKKDCSRQAPKLPRFSVPKDMSGRVFKTKKDKAETRQSLNQALRKTLTEISR